MGKSVVFKSRVSFASWWVIVFMMLTSSAIAEEWVAVPGGTFVMGDKRGDDNEAPVSRKVAPFEIMKYEVTNEKFSRFIEKTGYVTDVDREGRAFVWTGRWRTDPVANYRQPRGAKTSISQLDLHPVTQVSARDALAFCMFQGARLPTEAEWEFAARGRKANAYYWGSQVDPLFANYGSGDETTPFTTVVGKYPANSFSVQDMAGNVWEWVQDCWHKDYVGAPKTGEEWKGSCSSVGNYTRRGGAWDARPQGIRSANRSAGGQNDRSVYYGFRVAHDYEKNKK